MALFDLIVEDVINEISPEQAYTNFYNEIPREDFDKIVSANKKFDALVKFLLKEYMEGRTDAEECVNIITFYKAIDNRARIEISNKIKQNEYEDVSELIYDLEHPDIVTKLTRTNLIKNGYALLGKNDRWVVTSTFTYEANRRHFGYTEWCTASDRLGRFDGYHQFLNYTNGRASLIQVTDINNKKNTYQIQVYLHGNFGQICNVADKTISHNDLSYMVGDEIIQLIKDNAEMCCSETNSLKETEEEYQKMREPYYEAKRERIRQRIKKLYIKAAEMNEKLSQKTETLYERFINEKMYENVDFLNSLETFDEIYKDNDSEKIINYFDKHNNAVISKMDYISDTLMYVYVLFKTPFYYTVNEDDVKIITTISYSFNSIYKDNEYQTRGVLLIAEDGEGYNMFKRVIRKAFDINEIGTATLFSEASENTKNKLIFFTCGNCDKGFIYMTSNGNVVNLVKPAHYYYNTDVGDKHFIIHSSQYLIFSNDYKELIDNKCEERCALFYDIEFNESYGTIIILNDRKNKTSVLYTSNEILYGGKIALDSSVSAISVCEKTNEGVIVSMLCDDNKFISVVIDKTNNKIFKIFEGLDGDKYRVFYIREFNNVYCLCQSAKFFIGYDLDTNEYFRNDENGDQIKCDKYGNLI